MLGSFFPSFVVMELASQAKTNAQPILTWLADNGLVHGLPEDFNKLHAYLSSNFNYVIKDYLTPQKWDQLVVAMRNNL